MTESKQETDHSAPSDAASIAISDRVEPKSHLHEGKPELQPDVLALVKKLNAAFSVKRADKRNVVPAMAKWFGKSLLPVLLTAGIAGFVSWNIAAIQTRQADNTFRLQLATSRFEEQQKSLTRFSEEFAPALNRAYGMMNAGLNADRTTFADLGELQAASDKLDVATAETWKGPNPISLCKQAAARFDIRLPGSKKAETIEKTELLTKIIEAIYSLRDPDKHGQPIDDRIKKLNLLHDQANLGYYEVLTAMGNDLREFAVYP